jgi:preprotein translocase subunit SecF
MQIFKTPNFDFVRWRWHAIVLSLVIIGIGMAKIATQGMPLGVEFEGGTIVILKFEQPPDP